MEAVMKPTRALTLGCVLLVFCPVVALAGDGMVALQTADPSCGDDSGNRYVDCGNGTVTDNQTGLVWLANAECFGPMNWHSAMDAVAGLADLECDLQQADCDCGLSDSSSPGEWRLPSRAEWRAMIGDAVELGCSPTITNDAEDDCWDQQCFNTGNCSFTNVQSASSAADYWSSSTFLRFVPEHACSVTMTTGHIHAFNQKLLTGYSVWPVRGGQ